MIQNIINASLSDRLENSDIKKIEIFEQIGLIAGISPKTVRNIFTGNIKRPPAKRLPAFSEVLNLSLESLIIENSK